MANTITIDPATRLEGHLKIEATYNSGVVATAKSGGMMFRGFENLLVGKDPRDAAQITQRICGVCPTNHAMAACLAMEALAGFSAPDNARIIRNLILGADFIQSHILHFYHLALPSYVKFDGTALAMPPWTPSYGNDLRLSATDNQRLLDHYVQALAARRQAHEMGAIFAGKLPHVVAYEFGGVTVNPWSSLPTSFGNATGVPSGDSVTRFGNYLSQLISFIDGTFLPDVDLLGQVYSDYYQIGRGYGNLLAFGVFDLNANGSSKLLARGRVENGGAAAQSIDLGQIVEQTNYSWYADSSLNPSQGATQPSPDKAGAYSWLKAPRYGGVPYEAGALARMWVNGDYRRGISVMDRHQARAKETSKIAHAMQDWLSQLNPSGPVFTAKALPSTGSAVGLTEAPRGALGHWLKVSGGTVASYQILTPTCWNCSPLDASGKAGPLENALVGTPVSDATKPIEVLRVVQSFDPCLSCAVH